MKVLLALIIVSLFSLTLNAEVGENSGQDNRPTTQRPTISPEIAEGRRIHDNPKTRYQALLSCNKAMDMDSPVPFVNGISEVLPQGGEGQPIVTVPWQNGSGFYAISPEGVYQGGLLDVERSIIERLVDKVYQSEKYFQFHLNGQSYGRLALAVERGNIYPYRRQNTTLPSIEGTRDTSPQYESHLMEPFRETMQGAITWTKNSVSSPVSIDRNAVKNDLLRVFCACKSVSFFTRSQFLEMISVLPEEFRDTYGADGALDCVPLVALNSK